MVRPLNDSFIRYFAAKTTVDDRALNGHVWHTLVCALLDRDHPEVVLERCEGPILEPVEDYELSGGTPSVAFSPSGGAPNVVFSCGAVVIEEKLVLYYGGADKVIGVAVGDLPGKPI